MAEALAGLLRMAGKSEFRQMRSICEIILPLEQPAGTFAFNGAKEVHIAGGLLPQGIGTFGQTLKASEIRVLGKIAPTPNQLRAERLRIRPAIQTDIGKRLTEGFPQPQSHVQDIGFWSAWFQCALKGQCSGPLGSGM